MAEEANGINEYHQLFGHATHDPQVLFKFLVVAVFQPGLSWKAAASKLPEFDRVFAHFDAQKVAGYDEETIEEIENDPAMIRNPRKIRAIVQNARAIVQLNPEFKDFADYLWSFQGADGKTVAKDMKQRGFTFVGPTTIQLMLVGTEIAPRPMK